MKRLISKTEYDNIKTICPFDIPLIEVENDYTELTPKQFATKYRGLVFKPSGITDNNLADKIQYNFCDNPFCDHFSKHQVKYINLKNKPSRYKIGGSDGANRVLVCNDILTAKINDIGLSCNTNIFSNWAIAEEIKRIIAVNSLYEKIENYNFHNELCTHANDTPFINPQSFYRKGKSTSGSQRYQCKYCKKYTNVLPDNRKVVTYKQKKNGILINLTKHLLSRTPVSKTCKLLNITPETYYHKLELIYIKCLEFLKSHEYSKLSDIDSNEIWLNTDKMSYFLNNIRKRGTAKSYLNSNEEIRFPTYIVATTEVFSKYVFAADISYNYFITLDDIREDTLKYKIDHMPVQGQKYAHLRFPFCPQQPTKNDTQSFSDYNNEYNNFLNREQYIDGMHVNSTYTAIAQFHLLRKFLGNKKYVIISDDDVSLQAAALRVFNYEIKNNECVYFICKTNKTFDRKERFKQYQKTKKELNVFIKKNNIDNEMIGEKAYIEEQLSHHIFQEKFIKDGNEYYRRTKNFLRHPNPSVSEGERMIGCLTPVHHLSNKELSNYLVYISNHSVDLFFNKVRRDISILERPLVSATNTGKSYIYSNYNPKYAQYALTILRTVHNFCEDINNEGTPAQRLGITKKQYTIEDIIKFNYKG